MIFSIVLFLISTLAYAGPFNPMSITPARVAKHLARPGEAQGFAWQFGQLNLRPVEPGLLLAGASLPSHILAARKYARLIYPRYGYVLVLASRLDDFITPVFSGVVLDRDGRAIANFKLLSRYGNHEAMLRTMQLAAEKIVRYSGDRGNYARLAYKDLLELAGFPREADIEEVRILSKAGLEGYRSIIRDVTRTVALFNPGRPTWILAELRNSLPFTAAETKALRELTTGPDVLARIFVRTSGTFVTSRGGAIDLQPRDTCEIDLT